MSFDPISYLEALKSRKLSNLIIDADKDWGGRLIKNLGEPTEPNDAATKIYIDIASTGLGINYYLLDEADAEVPAYKKMSITPPSLPEAYVEIEENSAGDYLIQEWIAEPDGIPVVKLGVYTINFQSEIVGGGAKIRFFFRLYERQSDGTENLIVESTPSNRIKKERENVVTSAVLTSDYVMATGSRLVLKLYARWEENRSATVRIYYQGTVRSRLAVPIAKEILDTLYAQRLHASQHGKGGEDELSLDASQIVSGVLSADRIPDLSRSKITDFFSSPFWDNIPDKPSYFPSKASLFTVDADIIPDSDNTRSLGSESVKWANIHAVNVYANGLNIKGDALFYFNRIRRAIGWPVQYDGRTVSFIIPGLRDVLYCAIDRGLSVTVNRGPDSGDLADMFRFASKTQNDGAIWNDVSDTNPVQIEIDVGNAHIDVIVIEFGWRNRLAIDYTIELYHDHDGDGTYVWETLVDVVGNSAYVVAHEAKWWRVRKIRITVTKAGDGDQAGILHIANIQALSSIHGVGFPHCLSVLGGTMYGTINAQDVLPKSDNTYSLGSDTLRWKAIYVVDVYTGDINLDNGWKITELPNGVIIKNEKGEEVFRITEEGVWFKGKKIAG